MSYCEFKDAATAKPWPLSRTEKAIIHSILSKLSLTQQIDRYELLSKIRQRDKVEEEEYKFLKQKVSLNSLNSLNTKS